jgi:hypothetical protein
VQYFWSPSIKNFLVDEVHGSTVPSDAKAITETQYRDFLTARAQGKIIQSDADGNPETIDPPTPAPSRLISKWLFNLRFTQEERIAIYTSTDPVVIMIRNDYIIAPDPMNMDDSNTTAFMNYFTSSGILASGRQAEILA